MKVNFKHEKKINNTLILFIVFVLICFSECKVSNVRRKGNLDVEQKEAQILQTPANLSKSAMMIW